MNNKAIIDSDVRYLSDDEQFKLAINFITYFVAKVESFYKTGEVFTIEFTTEENYGQLDLCGDEIIIRHNVFDDFVTMRNYIKDYIKELDSFQEHI
jgi:hypothetical protein